MKLTNGLYTYGLAQRPDQTMVMRIGNEHKDHTRFFKENELFVGAGFIRVIGHSVLVDGRGTLPTYNVTADSGGIEQASVVGLRPVTQYLCSIMHMMHIKVSYQGNLVSAYDFISRGM